MLNTITVMRVLGTQEVVSPPAFPYPVFNIHRVTDFMGGRSIKYARQELISCLASVLRSEGLSLLMDGNLSGFILTEADELFD
jgi:hypothetical protein